MAEIRKDTYHSRLFIYPWLQTLLLKPLKQCRVKILRKARRISVIINSTHEDGIYLIMNVLRVCYGVIYFCVNVTVTPSSSSKRSCRSVPGVHSSSRVRRRSVVSPLSGPRAGLRRSRSAAEEPVLSCTTGQGRRDGGEGTC